MKEMFVNIQIIDNAAIQIKVKTTSVCKERKKEYDSIFQE